LTPPCHHACKQAWSARQRRVAKKAAAQGISIGEYGRRAVAADLGATPPKADVSGVFDFGRSAKTGGRLEDWRRIAIRYDRCAHTFFSAVCIAASLIFYLNQ
jgi:hypothetical protein